MESSNSAESKRILRILQALEKEFGDPEIPLHFQTYEQFAIAVILSAQTTDEQVNKITPALFARFPDLLSLAQGDLKEIESLIYSTGFYHAKARNIRNFAQMVTEKYSGKLPSDFATLLSLPGVGRKTANVIMDCVFNTSVGVVVDTHVKRISKRLGFTTSEDPVKIEQDLMKVLPKKYWKKFSLQLIYHGRKTCLAKKPRCGECNLRNDCPSADIF